MNLNDVPDIHPAVSPISRGRHMRRIVAPLVGFLLPLAVVGVLAQPAGAATTHATITASGSSWAANAVNQWIADVQSNGLQVVFTANGSAQGRKDYGYSTTDFGVSDIGYQGHDPVTGDADVPCTNPNDPKTCRAYAYLPVVAGGTSFPYQIRVGGQLVRNLRLSGHTLALIFTNQIRNWSDPRITADNNGHALPSIPIIPVVHSEGSGSTAQFTRYLGTEFSSIWKAYSGSADMTEYFPRKNPQVAQNGSDGVMNFVSSAAANGAIGYDEYSYALGKGYPVVNLENSAGYFTAPTQYNVAVALTKAHIVMNKASKDYLLQDLDDVYSNSDKRTYPMSSYSYMIIPTGKGPPEETRMTTAKRQTLADFTFYSICSGQAEMGPIGYSPLPINLVEAGFAQINKLHTADPSVSLQNENVTHCNNPTFIAGHPSENHLAQIAPEPPACAKSGAGPCAANVGIVNSNPTKNGKAPKSNGGSPGSGGNGGAGGTGAGGSGAGTNPGSGNGNALHSSKTAIDPTTGQPVTTGTQAADGTLIGSPTTLPAANNGGLGGLLAVLAAVELLLLLAVPPVLARRFNGRKTPTS